MKKTKVKMNLGVDKFFLGRMSKKWKTKKQTFKQVVQESVKRVHATHDTNTG